LTPEAASADERALAERFWRYGDESAFRALYRRQTPLLYRVAYRVVGNADRANDIVQDTWLRAAQGLPSFRWQSSLSTWLVGIAVNRCREEIRRTPDEVLARDELPEPPARNPDPWQRLDLERAIAQLPEGYREILLLHDVEGYTHEEIAQALEIEASTSRSQLARARAAMRASLEQRMDGPHDT
jgi:RNA polymerase sigma-70 factor (ECF subfamily)